MLLVLPALLVFLLFLVTVTPKFRRNAGIFETLPAVAIVISVLVIPSPAKAQLTRPEQTSPSVPPANELPEADGLPTPSPEPVVSDRPVSWKLLYHNVIADQKHIWSFPARLVQGQNWTPTTAVLGATAGLTLLDPREAGYFRGTQTFHGFKNIFTGNAMAIGTGAVPASLYAIGLLRKDSKMQRTALLAGEALADTAIVQTVLKDATRRVKPARYPASGWFQSKGPPASYIRGNGSFPSGHSMAAFSVATIFARQYRNRRWVPYVAYGLAALVGFSRLPLNVHFASDVLMGGAIGYSISRFTVLRQ